jgi:hypothetical protein
VFPFLTAHKQRAFSCAHLYMALMLALVIAGCGNADDPEATSTQRPAAPAHRTASTPAAAPHRVSDIVVVCASGQVVGYDGSSGKQVFVYQRPAVLQEGGTGHCSAYSNGSWSPDFQHFVQVAPVDSNGDLPAEVDIASGKTRNVGETASTDSFAADEHQAVSPAIDYEGHVWWIDVQDNQLAVMRETEQMATVNRDKYGTPSLRFAPGGKWELVGSDSPNSPVGGSPIYIAPDGSTSKRDPLADNQVVRIPAEQLAERLPETELQNGDGLESSDGSMIYYVLHRLGGVDQGQLWVEYNDEGNEQPLSPDPLPAPPGTDNPAPDSAILGVIPPSVKVALSSTDN